MKPDPEWRNAMTARSTRWEIALVALLLVVLMRGVVAAPTDRWQTRDRAHSRGASPEALR
jgi:hypothetical protein